MAFTTTTTAESVVNPEWIDEAMRAARAKGLFMPGEIGRSIPGIRWKNLQGLKTKTASFPIEDFHVGYDVTEGEDHTVAQAYEPTDTTVATTEKIALEVITDMDKEVEANAVPRSMRMISQALAEKYSSVIYALHNGFDTDSGSTGASATWSLVAGGRNSLESGNMPGPYTLVIHPQQYNDIVDGGTVVIHTANAGVSDDVLRTYQISEIAGINVIRDSLIPLANASADRSGAIYSGRSAVGVAVLWELRFGLQRDESWRVEEVAGTQCYGAVEIDGTAANGFETDA